MERPHQLNGGEQQPEVSNGRPDMESARRKQIPDEQSVLDEDHRCRHCGAHFSEPCAPDCPREAANRDAERELAHADVASELAELITLTEQPDKLPTLVEFAQYLRADVGPGATPPRYDLEAVKRYQLPGIDPEDAVLLAGFEYFLREKLAEFDEPDQAE